MLVLILALFLFAGCTQQPKYSYVIGVDDSQTQSVSTLAYVFDYGDIYSQEPLPPNPNGIPSTIAGVRIYKLFEDGEYEEASGYWSVEPSNIAYCDITEEVVHTNYVNIMNKGVGKLKVLIPSEETTVEKNVIVYGTYRVCDHSDGEYPQTLDFDPEIDESDIYFEGTTITADYITSSSESLKRIIEIPQDGYVSFLDYERTDIPKWGSFVLKTKEGYYAKICFGQRLTDGQGNSWFDIHYMIEKDSTTEFAY